MKNANFILLIFLGIMVIPILSIVALSLQSTNGDTLKWYRQILTNEDFTGAFFLSLFISFCTALLNTILSFIISLSWFNKNQLFFVLVLLLILGLLPPDIMALSVSKSEQFLGFYSSNLFFLVIGLTLYTLPFGVLLFWTGFYFVQDAIIIAAKDIGVKKFYIITKILAPLSKASAISCILFSFLLVFNEYTRTFYLSGSNVLVSEFLNGKLSSGANNSIYAGGSITIFITTFFIILFAFSFAVIKKRRRIANKKYSTV